MFPFTIRQLEIFLAVCEAHSFRKAAENLRITQAGVSNHIKALEQQLDRDLFVRRKGGISRLSHDGLEFRRVALELSTVGSDFKSSLKSRKTVIRLVVGDHLMTECIKPALADFYLQNPNIEMEFIPLDNYKSLQDIINDPTIDCALAAWGGAETEYEHTEYEHTEFISHVPAGIFATPSVAQKIHVGKDEKLPVVVWPLGGNSDTYTLKDCEALGFPNAYVAKRVQHFDDAILLAMRGIGAVLVRESMISAIDKKRSLVMISPQAKWSQLLYLNPKSSREPIEKISFFVKHCIS